jgi:cell pole-organizing protein PopZ
VNGAAAAELPWALGRTDGAQQPASPAVTARTDHGGRQQPPAEEITLSRPETLRPSLPPLFGADEEEAATLHVSGAEDTGLNGAVAAVARDQAAPAEPKPATAPEAEAPAAPTAPALTAAPVATAEAPSVGETAASAAARPNGALEDLIAQLLEPVLVSWLDANLPRLIEKTVRAEVERALSARRPGPGNG